MTAGHHPRVLCEAASPEVCGVREGSRWCQPGVPPAAPEEVPDSQEVQEAELQEGPLDLLSEEAEETKLPTGPEDCSETSHQNSQHQKLSSIILSIYSYFRRI